MEQIANQFNCCICYQYFIVVGTYKTKKNEIIIEERNGVIKQEKDQNSNAIQLSQARTIKCYFSQDDSRI